MSRHTIIACILAVCVFAAACPSAQALSKADLAALVAKMPNDDPSHKYTGPEPAEARAVYDDVLKGGKDAVVGLVDMVLEPGKGEDYKVRYLLHGIVTYVARPGADQDRLAVCEALAQALSADRPAAVKNFVMQELQAIGGKEAVAPLSKFLNDEQLYDPAARALLAIGAPADVFRPALAPAKGRNRVAIIQALGRLRDVPSVAALKREAAAEDRDIRIAALDALANIGDIAAAETILAAAGSAQDFWEKQRATEDALTLAKRLGEAQHKPDAEQIYRTLWEKRTDRQVRIAALVGLTELRGDLADVLAAMKTGDPQIRAVAISLATATPGQAATLKCVAAMEQAAPSDRASLLEILGARADPAALPAILKMFKFPDEQVRSAAMLAAAAIGGEGAAEAIVACVCGAPGKDRDAAVIALGKMSGKEAGTAVAGALKQASDPAVKVALLTVVAARRQTDMADAAAGAVADSDPAVRAAAIRALGAIGGDKQLPALVAILKAPKDAKDQRAAEDALVAACARNLGDRCTDLLAPALADAPPATAASILRVLGAAGSRKAMEAVAAATKSASAETKDAAVRVLAGWPGKEAAPAMLAVAQNSDNPKHRVLVLRGIVRLAALKDTPAADSAKLLGEAMKSAKTPDEKREVLGGLSAVKTVEALQTAAACLDDEAIREEAAAAVVQIAEGLAKQEPAAVRDAVGKAAKATKNDQLRASAERILARVKK